MRTEKDVEAYLLRMGRTFSPVEEGGAYVLDLGASATKVALRVEPPLAVLRVHIGDARDDLLLYRRLLELNATALVHASYGLDDGRIVLSSALELENLDFNELEAVLDEIDLALAQQVPELAQLGKTQATDAPPAE